jgi:hypothetical protein
VAYQNHPGLYPTELLWGVSWTFRGQAFDDQAAFDAVVAEFQGLDPGEIWRPNEVVLRCPRVRVSPDVHWYLTDDHPTIEFAAANGKSFTMGELLFKVHNAFVAELSQLDLGS